MEANRTHDGEKVDRPRRGLKLAAALLAFAALVALFVASPPRASTPAEPAPGTAEQRAQPLGPQRPGAPTVASGARGAGSTDGAAFVPFQPHDTPMVPPPQPSAAFPYPPGSQPLTEGSDPAKTMKEDNPVDAAKGIRCVFGPRVAIVHPPDPLVIDLEVINNLGALMPIANGVARFRTEKGDPEKGPWFSTPLVDDGSGRDLAPGDRKYTATFLPSDEQKAVLLKDGVHLYVEVRFEAPQGLGLRDYVTTMTYSRKPDATMSGKYTESLDQGSLVIGAGVTVKVAGEYRLIGSLYGGADAIAFASKSVHLEAGDGTIPLLFFGKILHDRGIDGPYDLRYVMLFQRSGPDEIPGETIDPAYTTKPYKAASFSDKPYVPPAPTYEVVDQNSPSQRDKPPPLFNEKDRETKRGTVAPIRPDPADPKPKPVPAGTK